MGNNGIVLQCPHSLECIPTRALLNVKAICHISMPLIALVVIDQRPLSHDRQGWQLWLPTRVGHLSIGGWLSIHVGSPQLSLLFLSAPSFSLHNLYQLAFVMPLCAPYLLASTPSICLHHQLHVISRATIGSMSLRSNCGMQ